jgi:hypothetical protein
MSRLLLLSLLLLAPAALAQDGVVSFAETNRAEYAYGETIELRYTITNESSESITLSSSTNCAIGFTFGSFTAPGNGGCPAIEVHFDFAPGSSWMWAWQIIPNEHGVPEHSGEQVISAHFDDDDFIAETSIIAPQYLGGRISFGLADGFTLDDVQGVADTLNAILIYQHDAGGNPGGWWETSGITLQEAVETYAEDSRFRWFTITREIFPEASYTTDGEDGAPPPSSPVLTAAHPNPFAASTSFALTVPESGPTRVEVFDVLGRRVAVLHDGPLAAGPEHRFTFHAATLPSGLYVVRASGEGFTQTRRVTLSR